MSLVTNNQIKNLNLRMCILRLLLELMCGSITAFMLQEVTMGEKILITAECRSATVREIH